MKAARLHGPRDLRVEDVADPGTTGPGQVRLRVLAAGICGSDLHAYREGRIGDTSVRAPFVLGHEFSGLVESAGPGSLDGTGCPLKPGTRVAVDPAQPCGSCEQCRAGNPNLCTALHFCGLYPDDGCLRETMIMPASVCYPIPGEIDDEEGALLEPLGVALHTVDLTQVRAGWSASVHGAGPIGLLTLQTLLLAGVDPVFVVEQYPWRLRLAEQLGAVPVPVGNDGDIVRHILDATGGRGVDVAIEAGWGGSLVDQAAAVVRPGARVVIVGIPDDDRFTVRHSLARRKGLAMVFVRRMKHTYPRAIRLAQSKRIDLSGLVTHRFGLEESPQAFTLNDRYRENVVKVMIHVQQPFTETTV